jgi:tripartite-type tricarboxylate transporter receptor subunit TctC
MVRNVVRQFVVGASLILVTLISALPAVAAADGFYEGKTVRIIVMTSPGGGYDTYARSIARYLGKHIPGKPNVLVQNMPGAGGFIATNYVYKIAKPDGLTILVTNSGVVLQQAVGMKGIQFDARKFEWIGTPGPAIPVCAVMGFTGIKNFKELMNSKKTLNFGSAGTSTYQQPMILKLLVGAPIKIVQGYSGTSAIRAAMLRREVDGACWQWSSMRVTAKEMLHANGGDRLIPFIIEGHAPDPEVKNLPQFSDVIKDKEKLAAFNAWVSQYKFYTPFAFPPKTPKARLDIMRQAFKATIMDPDFRALSDKMQQDIEYVSGQEATRYVNQALSMLRPLILR